MNCIEGWTFTGGSAVWLRCVAPQSEPMWIFNLNAAWSSFAPSLSWLVSRPADTWNSIIIPFIIQNLSDLEYVFRAAMILYNLVTGCQPWTFIHPLNCYEQFKIIHGGSSGQILAGKTSWRSILNHSLSYFHHYQLGEGCPASSINIWLIQNVADIE